LNEAATDGSSQLVVPILNMLGGLSHNMSTDTTRPLKPAL